MIAYKYMVVKLKEYLNNLINIILAERCLLCSSLLKHDDKFPLVCNNCVFKTKKITGNRCKKCGMPLPIGAKICQRCKHAGYLFVENISIFDYRDWNLRRLIFQYKFKKRKSLAEYFAYMYFKTIEKKYSGILVVPVPTTKTSIRKRGWGHMEVISNILNKKYGVQTIELLKAKRRTKQQKKLNLEERKKHISGKFSVRTDKIKGLDILDKRDVILIDDVFTTGATVNECAKILKEEGFSNVHVITLAID